MNACVPVTAGLRLPTKVARARRRSGAPRWRAARGWPGETERGSARKNEQEVDRERASGSVDPEIRRTRATGRGRWRTGRRGGGAGQGERTTTIELTKE